MGRTIIRALRISLALAGTTFVGKFFETPELVWLTPVISALGKYLRQKYPDTYDWLPF